MGSFKRLIIELRIGFHYTVIGRHTVLRLIEMNKALVSVLWPSCVSNDLVSFVKFKFKFKFL